MALYLGGAKIAGAGGGGNANIVSCSSYEDYMARRPHDPKTVYVTPDNGGSGGSGGGSKVQLSCVATGGNTVAVISVDSVPYTLKSGPVGSTVSLSDVKTGGLKVADIAIDGVLSSLNTEALPVNSKTQDGIVAKGDGNANKVWATNSDGVPGWMTNMNSQGSAPAYSENYSSSHTPIPDKYVCQEDGFL